MSPDPAGVAFSLPSAPQSWNLYSYVQNNPLSFVDPDGRECVWDDGSYDSKDDNQTGSYAGCSAAGGNYIDPATFRAPFGQDWSADPIASLADYVAQGNAMADSSSPGIDQATWLLPWSSSGSLTIDFGGRGFFGMQSRFGNHPFRDNNPGNILFGRFTSGQGAIGPDGRFAVFPTSAQGGQALDRLLHGSSYINLSINDAVDRYAPGFENNTAGYQQFVQDVVGVSGNTPLSSLTPTQFSALENGISRYEGFNAPGGYSVTSTTTYGAPK